MKNEKKNKQGEPAMTQPKGANELNDDVLEAATGGARVSSGISPEGPLRNFVEVSGDDLNSLRQEFGSIKFPPDLKRIRIWDYDPNYHKYLGFLRWNYLVEK